MNIIISFLNRLTMYQVALYALRTVIGAAVLLSLFGIQDYYVWWHILGSLTLFVVFCWAINTTLARLLKVHVNLDSQFITAEILTLIVGPLNPLADWWLIFVISLLAMGSKYFLAFDRRNIFNPAAFAVLASAVLMGQGASWWAGGQYATAFVVIGGALIIQKLRWWHLAGSFLLTYWVISSVLAISGGAGWEVFAVYAKSYFLLPSYLFFAAVMLTEPMTAPRTRNYRILYGIVIATLMAVLPRIFVNYGYSIETALLLGNAMFFLTDRAGRRTLTLVEKRRESKDVQSFLFRPDRRFDFTAGQYMEWMAHHDKPDSRGSRRLFTISSAPTDELVRLSTKFFPKPSSFKQGLLDLKPGDQITAARLSGEFTMPEDKARKMAFIAGGIGVTPFVSMAEYLKDTGQRRDVILLYANKTMDDISFKDALDSAQASGVVTRYVLDQAPPGWAGPVGFISADMVAGEIPDWASRTFYVSGPEPMVQGIAKTLKGMGVAGRNIRRDYFSGY